MFGNRNLGGRAAARDLRLPLWPSFPGTFWSRYSAKPQCGVGGAGTLLLRDKPLCTIEPPRFSLHS